MPTDRALLQQALDALDGTEALLTSMDVTHLLIYGEVDKAATALRERLAQPEQDAVLAERETCAVIAETPISGEQDDITMEAKDRVAAAIRARGQA